LARAIAESVSSLSPPLVLERTVMLAVRLMAPLALLILPGCFPWHVAGATCPDDPELDLCDTAGCPDDPDLDLCDDGNNGPTPAPTPSPAGPTPAPAGGCLDDPETDLCDDEPNGEDDTQDVSKALSLDLAVHRLAFPLALALGFSGSSLAPAASEMTCAQA